MSDRVALELLYAQIVTEVLAGWITVPPAVLDHLQKYQLNNQKKEVCCQQNTTVIIIWISLLNL